MLNSASADQLPAVQQLARIQESCGTPGGDLEAPAWPTLDSAAFHGPAGEYVGMIEEHTEADPNGILVQFMVLMGNLVGRHAHFRVEADRHYLNLFAVLVGASSKGRKGVSFGQAKRLFEDIDSAWSNSCLQHGLASGEGLIYAVRDADVKKQPIEGAQDEFESVVVDVGADDKRLCIVEPEFASVLKQARREGNILSAVIRNAWDTGELRTLTKNSPARATGAHISIIGHITKAELLRYLDSTEAANGFGNRFLWCCVQRSKFLPEGGRAHLLDFGRVQGEVAECRAFAQKVGCITRDDEARAMWAEVYRDLSDGKPGLLGSMIGRAEAQTMRLACLYALLDRSSLVRAEHLQAALALWSYCEDSATWIFGRALGDPVADQILRALQANPEGLTRTDISKLFGRHLDRGKLSSALATLRENNLASPLSVRTGGRPAEVWVPARPRSRTRSTRGLEP